MPLDPLAKQGFNAALAYEHGRPGYPPEAVRTLISELGLSRSSRVLDLAAGTGKLSRELVPLVGSVVAVEPSESMREVLAQQVPSAEVLAGEAERLPVPDGSIDAIVVGEAFHWFHDATALGEMARALRPHGGLVLLWNVQLATDPPWPTRLTEEVDTHRRAAASDDRWYRSGTWRRAFEPGGPFGPLSSAQAEHVQHVDRDAIVAQIASWSYIAALPEEKRDAVLALIRQLAPSSCDITFRTDVYWTRKLR
jgi:SAM-dependent methyltransferase